MHTALDLKWKAHLRLDVKIGCALNQVQSWTEVVFCGC